MSWVLSWVANRCLPITVICIVLGAFLSTFLYGRHTANTAWEARWAAQQQADAVAAGVAQAAADDRLKRQKQAAEQATTRFQNEQVQNVRLAGDNAVLSERLRQALTEGRRDPVPAPAADPGAAEPEGERVDAGAVAVALSKFAAACAASRDDLGARVNALIDAWPR